MLRTTRDKEDRWYKVLRAIQNGCNTAEQLAERFAGFQGNTFGQKLYKAGYTKRNGIGKDIYYTLTEEGCQFIQQYNERKKYEQRRMLEEINGDC